jgi:hypothetical protein
MRNPLRTRPAAEPDAPAAPDALTRIRQLAEDDERPSREDRGYGETIFTRPPVRLPRILTGKRRPGRR